MSAQQSLRLNGAVLSAEAAGTLWWAETGTLIVSDLHLEKGSAFAARGVMLPPYDTPTTLALLAQSMRAGLQRVICLGDSFHDNDGPARLGAADAQRLHTMTRSCEWIWIAGNHDPAPPAELGGRVSGEYRLGPLTFRHIAEARAEPGEVSGHYHPKASLYLRGRRFSGPCFVYDEERLVMPALGAYAGGLDVGDEAVRALFPGRFKVALLARGRVIELSAPEML